MLNPTTTSTQYGLHTPQSRPTSLFLPPSSSTTTAAPSGFTPQGFSTLLTPTSGTPLAMTPNTLKSIEQSILQTLGEDPDSSYMMAESQQYSGNFVPPLPSSTSTITLINTWQGGQVSSSEMDGAAKDGEMDVDKHEDEQQQIKVGVEQGGNKKTTKRGQAQAQKKKPTPSPVQKQPATKKNTVQKQQPQQKTKQKGGEEDERRKIRRERNKLAAARCRKRRVDHTNKLLEETEGLEAKKRSLQNQITELQSQKEELEFVLEAHNCVKKIKSDVQVLSDLQNLPSRADNQKLKRPNTLNVVAQQQQNVMTVVSTPAPPIPINTPSNGIAGLGFEPLCSDWGVGVNTPTPGEGADKINVVPESRDLTSSSINKCNSLVTPVSNPYKKLHDL